MKLLHSLISVISGKGLNNSYGVRTRPHAPQRKQNSMRSKSPYTKQWRTLSTTNKKSTGRGNFIAYHGTPQATNAKSIIRHGWMVGSGNAYGDGIYFSKDIKIAQGYAGANGVILKCQVSPKRCALWKGRLPNQYQKWCSERKIQMNNSAKTAFLIQQGYDTLMVDSKTIIVLMPQYVNHAAWKKKIRGLKIISVHRASDNRRIRI